MTALGGASEPRHRHPADREGSTSSQFPVLSCVSAKYSGGGRPCPVTGDWRLATTQNAEFRNRAMCQASRNLYGVSPVV